MSAVRYFVSDLERSLRFYCDLFGFVVEERWGPAFAIVEKDGLKLWLSGPGTSAMKPMPDGRIPQPGGWNRIVLSVADFELCLAALHQAEVAFRGNPIEGPGGKQVLIEDPDGNPIEVFQPRSSE